MKINKFLLSLILFILSFLTYYPSLNHDFVWDDQSAIKINFNYGSFINSLTPRSSVKKNNYYRPTVYLSYLVDSSIWDNNPFGYHLSNIIFNASVVVLIFWFVFYFFLKIHYQAYALESAFVTSILFMLQPVHVESVSWISARTDVLCTLFLMLGILLHFQSSSRLFILIFTIIAFYLSLLSKELGVVFLPLILMIDFATGEIRKKESYIKYIIYIILLSVYFYLRSQNHVNFTAVSERNIDIVAANNLTKYIDILKVLASSYYTYIYKMILPIELNAFIYDVSKETYYLIGAFSFLSIIGIIFVYTLLFNYKIIYVSIFWILLTLGPSALLSIIKMTPTSLAERYLYLPSIGFCMMIGYLLNKYLKHDKYKQHIIISLIIIFSFYTTKTYSRQKVWENNLTFWKDASTKSEDACFPHNNYGSALRKTGDTVGAIKQFLYVTYPDIKCRDFEKALLYNNLGTVFSDIDKTEDARKYLESAINNNRFYFRPHLNLGISYLSTALESRSKHEFEIAEYYLNNAVELNPRSSLSHHYLSIVYFETGKYNLSIIHAKKAEILGLDKALLKDSLKIINEIENNEP